MVEIWAWLPEGVAIYQPCHRYDPSTFPDVFTSNPKEPRKPWSKHPQNRPSTMSDVIMSTPTFCLSYVGTARWNISIQIVLPGHIHCNSLFFLCYEIKCRKTSRHSSFCTFLFKRRFKDVKDVWTETFPPETGGLLLSLTPRSSPPVSPLLLLLLLPCLPFQGRLMRGKFGPSHQRDDRHLFILLLVLSHWGDIQKLFVWAVGRHTHTQTHTFPPFYI